MANEHSERLEYLRAELRAERISQGELIELASLSRYIEAGDVELLEAAGVPEFHATRYTAHVNVPGYLPMADEPALFDTAREAWAYLADERERGEDNAPDDEPLGEYTDTLATLRYIASDEHEHGNLHEDTPTEIDGTGTVYGSTPGYDGDHDLGLAYTVAVAETDGES